MKKYLSTAALLLLITAATNPAAAQTARIAHFSHSGSPQTLSDDVALDNFGWYQPSFHADSARLISEKMVVLYGRWTGSALTEQKYKTKTDTLRLGKPGAMHTPAEVAELYRTNYPQVKLIGFDAIGVADQPKKPATPKLKSKRKKAAFLLLVPAPPQYPGIGLVTVLALAGAGGLFGKRRIAKTPAV